MARKVRDANLESRNGRAKLKARGKPHYRLMEQGLHVGYRKARSGAGRWVVRYYKGDGVYEVKTLKGTADDYADADGDGILSFAQAQDRCREIAKSHMSGTSGEVPTVRAAIQTYISRRDSREAERRGRAMRSDAGRLLRYVPDQSPLSATSLRTLDECHLSAWREGLPNMLKGSTRQRLVNDLKAALNEAYRAHRSKLGPNFPLMVKHSLRSDGSHADAPVARDNQILTDAQVTALIRAAREIDAEREWGGDLYRLVIVLAATGARFSQVTRLRVGDVLLAEKRVVMPPSRKGRGGTKSSTAIAVGADVAEALLPAITGRASAAPLLERWIHEPEAIDGKVHWRRIERKAWQTASELDRPWKEICKRAKMQGVIPYALRHSSIVRGIRSNLPIRLVAALHDTSVQMIERHYTKWIVSGLDELAAAAVVPLVPPEGGGKVVTMR